MPASCPPSPHPCGWLTPLRFSVWQGGGRIVADFGAAASRAKNKWRQDIKWQDMLQRRLPALPASAAGAPWTNYKTQICNFLLLYCATSSPPSCFVLSTQEAASVFFFYALSMNSWGRRRRRRRHFGASLRQSWAPVATIDPSTQSAMHPLWCPVGH